MHPPHSTLSASSPSDPSRDRAIAGRLQQSLGSAAGAGLPSPVSSLLEGLNGMRCNMTSPAPFSEMNKQMMLQKVPMIAMVHAGEPEYLPVGKVGNAKRRVRAHTVAASAFASSTSRAALRRAAAEWTTLPPGSRCGAAVATLEQCGLPASFRAGSTDANLLLSRGLPTVTIGLTHGDNAHRLDEYIEIEPVRGGMRQLILLVPAVSGWEPPTAN